MKTPELANQERIYVDWNHYDDKAIIALLKDDKPLTTNECAHLLRQTQNKTMVRIHLNKLVKWGIVEERPKTQYQKNGHGFAKNVMTYRLRLDAYAKVFWHYAYRLYHAGKPAPIVEPPNKVISSLQVLFSSDTTKAAMKEILEHPNPMYNRQYASFRMFVLICAHILTFATEKDGFTKEQAEGFLYLRGEFANMMGEKRRKGFQQYDKELEGEEELLLKAALEFSRSMQGYENKNIGLKKLHNHMKKEYHYLRIADAKG